MSKQTTTGAPAAARIVLKAGLLFAAVNAVFALLNPMASLGRLSVYNTLVPGRERLPYTTDAEHSYSLTMSQLDAMFASHAVARPKAPDEFRVVVIGDSAIWGVLLDPDQTIVGQLNQLPPLERDGRRMVFYNMAYPCSSTTQDLMLLAKSMEYQPDMVIWAMSLFSLLPERQFLGGLVLENAETLKQLLTRHNLPFDANDARLVQPSLWDRTLIGQRRPLADVLRLQLNGFLWAATGVDQAPFEYAPLGDNFVQDAWLNGRLPIQPAEKFMTLELIPAVYEASGELPLLIINQPIYIANSDQWQERYNQYFPRWAYDRYRQVLADLAADSPWQYLDLWDAVDPADFTDTPLHMNAAGAQLIAGRVWDALRTEADPGN